ncbi:Serine/threonine-protein kinase PrkC [Planctomycetes bacterium Pla163]|uniref:Serine/threonine-protein kinase PrkC n=1 Tax=Rohdeia mirabilis TaxID=2528008 RepID=A0A518D338_9BACT|nr:Serine/threonine-protein kinase PrkC [Planctomycetes bacterium Pla163]
MSPDFEALPDRDPESHPAGGARGEPAGEDASETASDTVSDTVSDLVGDASIAPVAGATGSTEGVDPSAPRAPRLANAPRIPGYRIDGVIGRGTTGTVYRAVQLAVEREVAVKVLHPELAARPQVVQRLQREARTMARLAHPHVVGAIDMGQVDGRWWFAMELVDGPSLEQLLRTDGPLSEREALRLFAPLCEAVEHLWEDGVVHRDIKPANILLERTGRGANRHYRARLADLGLAVGHDDPTLTRQGGTVGTPHYISPEQARDPRDVDVRSDLWALGATLFHAVCGRPPFDGSSAAEVLSAVLHQSVPDPRRVRPGLSPGLALVLRKCLVRDVERRYQSADALLADIERLRERRAPQVLRSELDPLEPDPRPWRRPLPWIGAAALAGAVALGLYLGGGPESSIDAGRSASDPGLIVAPAKELLAAADAEPRLLRAGLVELERVRDEALAAGIAFEWGAIRRDLVQGFVRATDALERDLATRIDQDLALDDEIAALAEIAEFEDVVAARLGLAFDELPAEARLPLTTRVERLNERVRARIDARVAAIERAVRSHYEALLAPQVDLLEREERWRSARGILTLTPRELVEQAGLTAAGLPLAALADATDEVLPRMASRRNELDDAWIARQRSLRDVLRLEAQRLEETAWPDVPLDPAVALPAILEDQLERIGLVREESLRADGLEVDRDLPELVERTRENIARRLENGARADADLRRGPIARSLGERRFYGDLERVWNEFDERLDAIPSGLMSASARRELESEARAWSAEAGLLEGVLDAAGEAVLELVGSEASFYVVQSVSASGVVKSGPDPVRDGFWIEVREGSQPYRMNMRVLGGKSRTLALRDLERLSGLSTVDAADLTTEQWLARVSLRWFEGDLQGAISIWNDARAANAFAGEGPTGELIDRLPRRLLGGIGPDRRARVDRLLEELDGGLAERDPELAAWLAEALLGSHMDDQRIGLRAFELARIAGR